MADTSAIISSSGGISAGTPFALGAGLFVQQVSPPVAYTQRWAALGDAVQSLVAPGVAGAPHTFVVGEGATDNAQGDRSVLIGYNVKQSLSAVVGNSVDQVLIGNTITIAATGINGAGTIVIGAGAGVVVFAAAPTVGGNIILGRNAIATGINAVGGDPQNNVLIGDGATSTGGGNTVVGANASNIGSQGTAIGQQAAAGAVCVAVGYKAGGSAAATDVTIGGNAKSGSALCVAVGSGANNAGSHGSLAFGANANTNGKTGTIMLGTNANVAADNWCQIGGDATYFISTICFGRGNAQATGGQTYTLTTTDTLNANVDGNTLQIQPGAGTGSSANAGNRGLDLQAGILGGAGSTPQVYTSCLAIRHSDLNIALWGGLAAPFSGGKGVLFIKNATTNPTVAAVAGGGILSVQGGQLHFLSSGGVDTALTPGGGGGTVSSGGMTAGTIPIASAAQVIGDSILSVAGGVLTVAGGTIKSDGTNNLSLQTSGAVAAISMEPNGTRVIGVALAAGAPDGIIQVFPGGDGTVALGGPTRRFKSLYLNGALALTLDNQTVTGGGQVGTITNTPTAGNPTGYLHANINGAVAYIPYWT